VWYCEVVLSVCSQGREKERGWRKVGGGGGGVEGKELGFGMD
jgi:hypothetical protein